MAPVQLPRYVIFKGDNHRNLCLHTNQAHPRLRFNSNNRDSSETQEMIPVPGQENVYMIKSAYNQRFWKRTPVNIICADHSGMPSPENLDCLFKVVQIKPKKVALQSLANKLYLHRSSSTRLENCLCAQVPDCFKDDGAQLEFSEVSPVRAVKLPRHVIFRGDLGNNLCLYTQSQLQFNSIKRELWGTQEVIPVRGQEYVVMIKNMHNKQFWRRSSNSWILADQSETPSIDNRDCLFKVVQISPYKVALQCLANNSYLKRSVEVGKVHCLKAVAPDCFDDVTAQLEFSEMDLVNLPRFVIFKGDNSNNLCLSDTKWLTFNSDAKDSLALHEVIPKLDLLNVVKIKSLKNNLFWRRSPNWIWADQTEPYADDADCLFKVVKISPNVVALQCLANDRYLRRLTTDGWESCLNAAAPDYSNYPTAQLEVIEGLLERHVFAVEYLWDLSDNTEPEPIVLGQVHASNFAKYKMDVQATVTYEVGTESTWSNSTAFTVGFRTKFSVSVPLLASTEFEVSAEVSYTHEWGETTSENKSFSSTVTVKDVEPGDTVMIRVVATKLTASIPFKYKFQEKLVNNITTGEKSAVDGIFKGVQEVDVQWEATDPRGNAKPTLIEDNKLVHEKSA